MDNTNNIFTEGLSGYADQLTLTQLFDLMKQVGLFDKIDLNNGDPNEIGTLTWNDGDRTLDIILSENVTANIPTEQLVPRCVNKTGALIPNGSVVYISGAQGSRPTITLANANTYATSSKTIGVATEDIANNAEGFVTRAGLVRDLNTLGITEGSCVFLDTTDGQITDTQPDIGNNRVQVGMVLREHATQGILCVKIHPLTYFFGDLDGGNYSNFEDDGTYVAKGDATTWEDLQFSISGGRVPASNAPTFDTFTTNTKEYAFDVNDFIYLDSNEPPHAHEANQTAKFHLHVANKTANLSGASQYVKFQVDIGFAYKNGVSQWSERQLTAELEIPDGTPALTQFIFGLGDFDLTDFGVGGQIKPTVKRIAATGGTEFADSVFLSQLGMHYKVDMTGSRQEIVK